MSKFKVGDSVRCVDAVDDLVEGGDYVITHVDEDEELVGVSPSTYTGLSFYLSRFEPIGEQEEHTSSQPVKSDGGSSNYYKVPLTLPTTLYDKDGNEVKELVFETQDILYALVGGEWSLSNIVKACRRAYLAMKGGGKEGNELDYDARKIIWFGKDFLKRFGKGE